MDILFNYISALLWGLLIGLILSGFVMYLAHKICGISYLISGLIGVFWLFFMTFQFTALIGANKTKKYVENVVASAQAVGENIDWTIVKDKYSLLESYLGKAEITPANVMDIKTMVIDSLNRYIWRRFGACNKVHDGITINFNDGTCYSWFDTFRSKGRLKVLFGS